LANLHAGPTGYDPTLAPWALRAGITPSSSPLSARGPRRGGGRRRRGACRASVYTGMLVLCVALVVVDMAARASSAGSLLRAVPRTPRPAPAPAPTEWPHHHQQGHGQTLLPVGDVPPLGPRTPDHGQSTDWAAGGPQHTQALSCNASRGAVTNLCWDGPSIRAQPGGASGSWFFPNVTSFNCSYTVPDTPAVYGPHSIFLWCGLQPGGGFGVIQPQIMYGPDCPEGFNRSRVGPFTCARTEAPSIHDCNVCPCMCMSQDYLSTR
jgi:hypothetical protein